MAINNKSILEKEKYLGETFYLSEVKSKHILI